MTPLQARLYNLLDDPPDTDVAIRTCYSTVYAGDIGNGLNNRDLQMKLGPLISRLNHHLVLRNQRIEPGRLKNTYRLNTDYRG